VDYREAAAHWGGVYRIVIPVLEQVLVEMRLLARGQPPLRRMELGMMDIGTVSDQLAHVVDRLDYWDRVAATAAMDA
jgi:hypothetical protein